MGLLANLRERKRIYESEGMRKGKEEAVKAAERNAKKFEKDITTEKKKRKQNDNSKDGWKSYN